MDELLSVLRSEAEEARQAVANGEGNSLYRLGMTVLAMRLDQAANEITRLRAALAELIKECDESVELDCVHNSDTVERARSLLRPADSASPEPR